MKILFNFVRTSVISMLIVFCLIIAAKNALPAQTLPVITNERGDTIHYTWPIDINSLCIKDEIIIQFKPEWLNLNRLCWNWQSPNFLLEDEGLAVFYAQQKHDIMAQQFAVDDIIADTNLSSAIKSFGGIYLKRITLASPCRDTLSITRYGDTIRVAPYLLMKLKLNNDTSIINACYLLTLLQRYGLWFAEPNRCKTLNNRPDPTDQFYLGGRDVEGFDHEQKSLKSFYTDARRAWDYQTGSNQIKVAVIDAGIDYLNPDLGGLHFIGNNKVIDGWNFIQDNNEIRNSSNHGTAVAGIIGAYTNGPESRIAGIAGGWYYNNNNHNPGCQLIGLKVNDDDVEFPNDRAYNAFYAAAMDYFNYYTDSSKRIGYGAHIINFSSSDENYSPIELGVIRDVFEQGVSIVASRANKGNDIEQYPACYNSSWVTSVGGHDAGDEEHNVLPQRYTNPKGNPSSYGKGMDLLAPGDNTIIATSKYVAIPKQYKSDVQNFGETSAAAPHVSGAIALLRAEALTNVNLINEYHGQTEPPEPEDYENMLKAAALDLNYNPPITKPGYDDETGWGQLKIGKIFEMLSDGYVLRHYVIENPNPPMPYNQLPVYDIHVYSTPYSRRKDDECLPGVYSAYRRERTGTYFIGNNWIVDANHHLYAWGRNGRTSKGGLNAKTPDIYLTGYTTVISGTGNNGDPYIEGIIHDNSRTVTALTYQYDLLDYYTKAHIKELPMEDRIVLYFSVFGKPGPGSAKETVNNNSILIYPNPAFEEINIECELKKIGLYQLTITDVLGQTVYNCVLTNDTDSSIFRKSVNTSSINPGLYQVTICKESEKLMRSTFIINN